MQAKALVRAVRSAFKNGPPNGSLLGWDADRLWDEIAAAVSPHECENLTTFDYWFCNVYWTSVPRPSGRGYFQLDVCLSFVADVYSIGWAQYSPSGRTGQVLSQPPHPEARMMEHRVRALVEGNGFREFPSEWSNILVPGVTLELGGSEATLGKCLFQDYES